ncbi:MAG: hypothetical protein ACXVW6_10645 [Nocardioidaceae bacterium]
MRDRARWPVVLLVLVATAGCTPAATAPAARIPPGPLAEAAQDVPTQRIIDLGFEDVVSSTARHAVLASRMDQVGATGVSISVGRVEWTAFPWPHHPQDQSSAVRATGRDYVGETMRALETDAAGGHRSVNLAVDALIPRWIHHDPSLAGVDSHGHRSSDTPTLTALTRGRLADTLTALVGDVARRYHPDSVSLTDAMFDASTFGRNDLSSYRRFSGRSDWPRTGDGRIHTRSPTIAAWRSEAMAGLATRLARAAHAAGSAFEIDVRAPWHDVRGDRAASGQGYRRLLAAADRLVVWDDVALQGAPAGFSGHLARALEAWAPGRFEISIGLWRNGRGAVTPRQLRVAVEAAYAGGATRVSVAPASLMTAAHWAALRRAWRR